MGWWETRCGAVIGDPPANYLDQLAEMGLRWKSPHELPGEIRERLVAIYVEGLGRVPSELELESVLAFCWDG